MTRIIVADAFCLHFERDLEDEDAALASDRKKWESKKLEVGIA